MDLSLHFCTVKQIFKCPFICPVCVAMCVINALGHYILPC